MSSRTRFTLFRKYVLLAAVCIVAIASTAFGQATSITSMGFGANQGGGGALNLGWTTGNLGNTWAEGEWVPYQLVINNVQNSYPNLNNFPNIVMEFDFTAQNDARFVDLVRSVQAGTTQLTNSQGWPRDNGTAYPMTTRAEIEQAQNDYNNAVPLENVWTGFTHLNLPNSQVNRAAPPGFADGTPDDQFRYFYITKQDLLDAGIPTNANTIVIYYQLHESRTFIWSNSLQEGYDQDPTDDWGGYLYSLAAFAADVRNGAGYVPGSSGQLRVSFGGGDKTVPIPIPERLPGTISGLKWFDENGNGLLDGSESTLDGWRIYVEGTLEGINFADTAVTSGGGLYSFPGLTSATTWYIFEDAQRYMPATSGWTQTYPTLASSVGVGDGWTVTPPSASFGAVGWEVALSLANPDQADLDFGNMLCSIEIACPPDVNRECTQSIDTQYTGSPTVTANCGPSTVTYSDSTAPGSCPQEYTIYRRFIATDGAGNADTCTQIITVQDNNDPWITGVGAADTIECPATPSFSTPSAFDSCDTDVALTYVDDTTAGACAQEYSIKRTWTATDDCGNSATANQTIWVEDNTAPVISGVGADDTVECPTTPAFSNPTATDACDPNPSLTSTTDTLPGSCPQEFTVRRIWTATDACGNSVKDTQDVYVEDNTGPVISGVGADYSIECPTQPVFSTPTATDACDPSPQLTSRDSTSQGTCPYTVTRLWTATDACGNESYAQQTITVDDNTAPVISGVGADATIECPNAPSFSSPTATDACDPNPTLNYTTDSIPGTCPQEYSLRRIWTATDGCSNIAADTQIITVEDNTAPVLSGCPNDTLVTCYDELPAAATVTASDVCAGAVTPVFTESATNGTSSCNNVITRKWVATDLCGNADSCMQVITVDDTTKPTLTCADDKTVICGQDIVFDDPTVADNCDPDPTVSVVSTDTVDAGGGIAVTRVWQATDACGNASDTCSQTVTRGGCGKITPTNTNCDIFVAGTSADLSEICYGLKGNKINSVAPGVFFYWTEITAPSASFTVNIVQTKNNASFPFFNLHGTDQAVLWSDECTKVSYGTQTSPGQIAFNITGASVGQIFIIGVKYSTSSPVGTQANGSPTVHYDFKTVINGSIVDADPDGLDLRKCLGGTTAVLASPASPSLPTEYSMDQNFPNPFNPATTINFALPQATYVTLEVYNILGQQVATLANGQYDAGYHQITWDASNQASGVYLYRLVTSDFTMTRKMLLLK